MISKLLSLFLPSVNQVRLARVIMLEVVSGLLLAFICILYSFNVETINQYVNDTSYNWFSPRDIIRFPSDQIALSTKIYENEITFTKDDKTDTVNYILIIDRTKSTSEYFNNHDIYQKNMRNMIEYLNDDTGLNEQEKRQLLSLNQREQISLCILKLLLLKNKRKNISLLIYAFNGSNSIQRVNNENIIFTNTTSLSTSFPVIFRSIYEYNKNTQEGPQWSDLSVIFTALYNNHCSENNYTATNGYNLIIISDFCHENSSNNNIKKREVTSLDCVFQSIKYILNSNKINAVFLLKLYTRDESSYEAIKSKFIEKVSGSFFANGVTLEYLYENPESKIPKNLKYLLCIPEHQNDSILFYQIKNFPPFESGKYNTILHIMYNMKPNLSDNDFIIEIFNESMSQNSGIAVQKKYSTTDTVYNFKFNEEKKIILNDGDKVTITFDKKNSNIDHSILKLYCQNIEKTHMYNIIARSKLSKRFAISLVCLCSLIINIFMYCAFLIFQNYRSKFKTRLLYISVLSVIILFPSLYFNSPLIKTINSIGILGFILIILFNSIILILINQLFLTHKENMS
jgi:ABC-type glycerol-3-phosphate transport system permease component